MASSAQPHSRARCRRAYWRCWLSWLVRAWCGLDCRMCHVNPDNGKLMTFPATTICMGCHQTIAADRPSIQKLASFAASGQPIPWVRVYQMPDYVYWKHGTHLAAGVTCAECHGPVAEHDVTTRETNVSTMIGCVALKVAGASPRSVGS